jgi:hypothetical protein
MAIASAIGIASHCRSAVVAGSLAPIKYDASEALTAEERRVRMV